MRPCGGIHDVQAALVQVHDSLDDGETEPRAARLFAGQANEWFDDPLAI
jgi:hypothetical protein